MSLSRPKPMHSRERKKRSFFRGIPIQDFKKSEFTSTAIKCICAFLLSRTSLIGGATPLGFSFVAANFGLEGTYACALASIVGLLFGKRSLLVLGKYIIAIILFALIQERFLPKKLNNSRIKAVVACFCMLATGYFLLYTDTTF